ncbi:MAG: hypothetical protein AAF721_13140 [Myxococcota bacterium]
MRSQPLVLLWAVGCDNEPRRTMDIDEFDWFGGCGDVAMLATTPAHDAVLVVRSPRLAREAYDTGGTVVDYQPAVGLSFGRHLHGCTDVYHPDRLVRADIEAALRPTAD